jgi:phenylalanyl-tRNA synthetase beta chain
MLVCYKWLQDYVDFSWSAKTLAKKLTDTGLEVKAIETNPRDSGDAILEIEVTPNRPDCLSIIGIAREIAVIADLPLKFPEVKIQEVDEPASNFASVKIEAPDLCPRYSARVIRGVKIASSPDWMINRLESVGIRAINNVVDITNYVLMEYGHPLHAFDLMKLDGKQIIVRRANAGETMITLDNQKRVLDTERLVIADAKRPVALAGVMGGANSEVLQSTTDLLIESAYFNPISIRKTSKKLGIRTESSYRFERGTDPENAVLALNRATQLITEFAGGKVAKGIIDVYPSPEKLRALTLRTSRVNEFLGIKLRQKSIAGILGKLGCQTKSNSSEILEVQVPSFRRDLEREIDLIEEIARIHGYDNVENTAPAISVQPILPYPELHIERTIRESLCHLGFWEVMNYSLVNSEEWAGYGFNRADMVEMRNPLSAEQNTLRVSLLPSVCQNVSSNLRLGQAVVRVFEIARIMKKTNEPGKFIEQTQLAVAASGKTVGAVWEEKGLTLDFYGFKGVVEHLFHRLELPVPKFIPTNLFYLKPGASAEIQVNGDSMGTLGQINQDLAEKWGLDKDCCYFELTLDKLVTIPKSIMAFVPLPKYPAILRDISILVPSSVTSEQICQAVQIGTNKLIESAVLFDLYTGDKIPSGYRSMSFRITYRHPQRTLQDSEIDSLHKTIIEQLTEKYRVKLRT